MLDSFLKRNFRKHVVWAEWFVTTLRTSISDMLERSESCSGIAGAGRLSSAAGHSTSAGNSHRRRREFGAAVSGRRRPETQNPGIEGSSGKGSAGGGGSVGSWISGRPGMSGAGSGASGVAGGAALSVSAVGA